MPDDVLLPVEVSDTTLRDAQGEKRDLYALHAICEYWVIDVVGEQVFVYTDPASGAYGKTQIFKRGDVLEPSALSAVTVADLFA